jgi:hypothetical protein
MPSWRRIAAPWRKRDSGTMSERQPPTAELLNLVIEDRDLPSAARKSNRQMPAPD